MLNIQSENVLWKKNVLVPSGLKTGGFEPNGGRNAAAAMKLSALQAQTPPEAPAGQAVLP